MSATQISFTIQALAMLICYGFTELKLIGPTEFHVWQRSHERGVKFKTSESNDVRLFILKSDGTEDHSFTGDNGGSVGDVKEIIDYIITGQKLRRFFELQEALPELNDGMAIIFL